VPPRVSILLVSWNAAAVVERCLRALDACTHQVVVVDNASDDESARIVAERFPRVELVRQPVNRGFAGGVNAGLPRCRGDLVLLLNCDTEAHVGSVDRLAAVLDNTPDCGAAGGALVDEHGVGQHGFHPRRFPTLWTWAVDLWLIDELWPDNPITRRYKAPDQTLDAVSPVDVDQPAAACLMIRRELLDTLAGMDEQFSPAWFEDVDLCRRIKDSGWRIQFVPGARFTHVGGLAMRHLGLARFSRIWYANLQRYVRKHHGTTALVVCKGFIVSGMVLRMAVVTLSGRWHDATAYAKVAWDALTTWP
jgi:GT2 family glycosyltransferase